MQYTDRLSDHWLVRELCRKGDWPYLEASPELQNNLVCLVVTALEPARVLCGCPLSVVSGVRSPRHNAAVKGAGESKHKDALAADVTPADVEWWKLRAHFLRKPGFETFTEKMARDQERVRQLDLLFEHHLGRELSAVGGIGWYPESGWIHIDIRPRGENGHIYRWQGKGFGSEK